jgi:hypothetical protein
MQTFPTRGDKAVRAQSIRGRMALMGLHVPTFKGWHADLGRNCFRFRPASMMTKSMRSG